MTTLRARFVITPLLGLAALATTAEGQFGIRGGVNLTKFVGDDGASSESTTGLNLGASIPLLTLGPLSIVPEVYYAQKGAKQFDPLSATTFEFGIDYIEVPVLAKLSIPLGGATRWYVAGGPAFAWRVDCSISSTSTGTSTDTSDCSETFGSFNTAMEKADRGVVVGSGLDFTIPGFGGLNLDARLVRGLTRLSEGTDIKNQAFSLMLGWYLGR
jgi:hypothetical protein